MTKLLARLVRSDEGQDLIEYGLLVGIITVGAITFITTIGGKVTAYFTTLSSTMP
jgi:pilus assembly protein Flp/PilA